MTSIFRSTMAVAMLAATLHVAPLDHVSAARAADSGPFSAAVRRACKRDYSSFCPNYSLYSTELRRCMQAAGKRVSKRCVRALVDAGEVPRSYLKHYK